MLAENSATLTLERWCTAHSAAGSPPARVVAEPDRTLHRPLEPIGRSQLRLAPDEPVAYRRVRLSCSGHVLSEADNWYVPGRLTPAMNDILERTDQPFGRVVMALGFTRTTLSSRLLWSPPPHGAAPLDMPQALMENRAVLVRADGRPIALLVESYRRGLLDIATPPAG